MNVVSFFFKHDEHAGLDSAKKRCLNDLLAGWFDVRVRTVPVDQNLFSDVLLNPLVTPSFFVRIELLQKQPPFFLRRRLFTRNLNIFQTSTGTQLLTHLTHYSYTKRYYQKTIIKMDKVIDYVEPYVAKADDLIAKYPSMTQYGMSFFRCSSNRHLVGNREETTTTSVKQGNGDQCPTAV